MEIQSSNGLFPPQLNSSGNVPTCGGGKRRSTRKMRKSRKGSKGGNKNKPDCKKLLKSKSVQKIRNTTSKMLCNKNKKCINVFNKSYDKAFLKKCEEKMKELHK